MNFKRLATGGLLLLLGCQGWQTVPMGPEDYVPSLNVIALLNPDEIPAVTMLVGRTLPLDSPISVQSGQDTSWNWDSSSYYIYPAWASLLRVEDAEITISWDAGQVELVYDSTSGRGGNFASYVPVDTTFVPLTGRTYYLVVRTPDDLEATGEVTIPAATGLSIDPLDAPWAPDDLITVHWAATTGNYRVGIAALQVGEQRFRIDKKEAVLDGDTSWSFIVPAPELFWWEDSLGLPDSYNLEVAVHALDANFRDYFYEGPGSNQGLDLEFLFGGGFITQSSFGMEGGLGVFGSYRRSTLTHLVGL